MALGRKFARGSAITHAEHKIAHMDILIRHIPMQPLPATADDNGGALLGLGMQQTREKRQRHSEATPVGEVHPHQVVVKADGFS